jgi:hypothetical protein
MDKLQVFLSWSGDRSLAIAKEIKAWLPDVVRHAEPWLSDDDLRKGLQWLPELSKQLNSTGFGLLILTAENKNAPWLVFEAGVVSKALSDKHCCPVLCDIKPTDVSGPLTQFQSTVVIDQNDMLKLVKSMNEASGSARVPDDRLEKWFARSWIEFKERVDQVLASKATAPTASEKARPSDRQMLEEILQAVRSLAIDPKARILGRHAEAEEIARRVARRLEDQLWSDPLTGREVRSRKLHRMITREIPSPADTTSPAPSSAPSVPNALGA